MSGVTYNSTQVAFHKGKCKDQMRSLYVVPHKSQNACTELSQVTPINALGCWHQCKLEQELQELSLNVWILRPKLVPTALHSGYKEFSHPRTDKLAPRSHLRTVVLIPHLSLSLIAVVDNADVTKDLSWRFRTHPSVNDMVSTPSLLHLESRYRSWRWTSRLEKCFGKIMSRAGQYEFVPHRTELWKNILHSAKQHSLKVEGLKYYHHVQ